MKQTEIGMIPDDWEVKEFKHICKKITDGSHFSPVEKEIVFFMPSVKDMRAMDFDFSECKKISSEDYQKLVNQGCKPEVGDVLIAKDGSILKYAFTVKKNNPIVLLSSIAILRPLKNVIDSDYLSHFVISEPFKKYAINNFKTGTGVPRIVLKGFERLEISLPPTLDEQQKIAKALSDVDNVISTLEKLITKKKNLKQGTMQQLLTGKKRLPGFAKSTKFKQTEIGEIPEDWEVVNINKTCTIKARIGWQGLKSDEYLDTGDYVLVTGTDFDNGFINWKNCSYVSEWRYKQDKNIQIKQGDVLVTKDGTIGKIAFLDEIPMNGTLNSGVFVVRPKKQDNIDSVYLSLIFKSFWFDDFLEQITSGSTIVHLYQKDFVKFNFILPTIEEQTAIANVLSSMDKEIEALNTKLEKYRNLKTGMMQQLLTGKIRLM